MAYEAIKT